MPKYKLYFQFYGKKYKTTVEAASERAAKQEVIERLEFLKVETLPSDPITDYFFNNIFKTKKP
jgi:hypothetical protein